MKYYMPDRVFFIDNALDYPLGSKLYGYFKELAIPVSITTIQIPLI